jgi:hypothetical protein
MSIKFTVEELLEVQKKQIEEWKPKLSKACYNDLVQWIGAQNGMIQMRMSRGDSTMEAVKRGTSLDEFIGNWKPRH